MTNNRKLNMTNKQVPNITNKTELKITTMQKNSKWPTNNRELKMSNKRELKMIVHDKQGKVKSAYEPSGSSGRSLSRFRSMKRLGVFLLPRMGC